MMSSAILSPFVQVPMRYGVNQRLLAPIKNLIWYVQLDYERLAL